MHVRVERRDEPEPEFAQQRDVAPLVLEHRIDDDGLA